MPRSTRPTIKPSPWFKREPLFIFTDEEIFRGELQQRHEGDSWEVRLDSNSSWKGLDTRSHGKARVLAERYLKQVHQYQLEAQVMREHKVIEGIDRLSLKMLLHVKEVVDSRVGSLFAFQTNLLFADHELAPPEASQVGILLMRKQLEELQEALAKTEEKHQQQYAKKPLRKQKCEAVVEQINALQRSKTCR